MSGSTQGAGGVGGLLMVREHGNGTYHFPAYDGNGNVAALVETVNGNATTVYEYGPFGETLRVTGTMGKLNPFRFSTKYADDESNFLYYGYRYFNPTTGRWLSRDPKGEPGGLNLYGFQANDLLSFIDPLGYQGMRPWPPPIPPSKPYFPPGTPPVDPVTEYKTWIDKGVVPGCFIVIYIGHTGGIPQLQPLPCSAVSAVACEGGTIPNPAPIPEIEPRPPAGELISLLDAAGMALRDFAKAEAFAKTICRSGCCPEVTITINCVGLKEVERKALSAPNYIPSICGRMKTIKCNTLKR